MRRYRQSGEGEGAVGFPQLGHRKSEEGKVSGCQSFRGSGLGCLLGKSEKTLNRKGREGSQKDAESDGEQLAVVES